MVSCTITTRNGDTVDLDFRYPNLETIRKAQEWMANGDNLTACEVLVKLCAMDKDKITEDVVLALSSDEGEFDDEGKETRKGILRQLMYTGTVSFRRP